MKEFQEYAEKNADYKKALEAQEATVAPAMEAIEKKGKEFADEMLKELGQ